MSKFVLFPDTKGEWRWTFHADNGEPIAVSSEGYVSKASAFAGLQLVQKNSAEATVETDHNQKPVPEPAILAKPKAAKRKTKAKRK